MKSLIIFAVCIVAASAYSIGSPVLADAEGPNGRITRGERAAPGQFPYQVGLSLRKNFLISMWCGGSLISSEWVLTAAHCTQNIPQVTVYLGATQRLSPAVSYTVTQDDVIVHEAYNPKTVRNDISLIRIPRTSFNDRISPVKLPSNDRSSYIGDRAVASGWGQTSDSKKGAANDLMYTTLTVVSNLECITAYGYKPVASTNICVETPDLSSTCQGDSGGPLVLESSKVQIGITSYGALAGCEVGLPAAFTRVSSYLPWLEQNTGLDL